MARRTADDDIGYRRGVLLGFTISEMVLLLVFILLLTFGWIVSTLNNRLAASETALAIESDAKSVAADSFHECQRYAEQTAEELEAADSLVSKVLGVDHARIKDQFDDAFRELEIAKREQTRLALEVAALRDKAQRYDEAIATITKLRSSTGSADEVAAEVLSKADRYDALVATVGTQDGAVTADTITAIVQASAAIRKALPQVSDAANFGDRIVTAIKQYGEALVALGNCRKQVAQFGKELGKGADYPPCWTDSVTHKAAFIFDIAISDAGLVVADTLEPEHASERAELPIQGVRRGVRVPVDEFVEATRDLKSLSDRLNCRHFVRIRLERQTAAEFKQMLRVEEHFYKLLVRQLAAPGATALHHVGDAVAE